MAGHLTACGQREASGTSPVAKQQTSGPSFHLVIEGRDAKAYWMHVTAPLAAPLSKLDRFLRDTWLECCGHLSAFRFGPHRYASLPDDGEMGMRVPLGRLLEIGMRFSYEYDYGSTTALTLNVVALREEAASKGAIQLLAANEPPKIECQRCGNGKASLICVQCVENGDGWLCEACAKKHECGSEMFLPVVNSPRVGVCAYAG
jgi:hypothetical protein